MNEVTCRLFSALRDIENQYGIPIDEGLAGIDVSREFLENPRNRMGWDVFAQIMRNYHSLAGSAREFANMNRVIPFTEGTSSYRRLCRIAVSPATTYRLATSFIPRIYTPVRSKFTVNRNGTYTMVVTIDPAYEDCPEFFDGAIGALETYPILVGLPMARVEGRISERRGEYKIFPPTSGTLLARTKRLVARMSGFRSVVTTLQNQNDDLLASFEALEQQAADFQAVLDTLNGGVAVIRRGRVIYANASLLQVLGVPESASVEGASLNEWVEPTDVPRLTEWLESSEPVDERREIRILRTGNSPAIVELSPPRPCSWQGHRAKLIILRDVTEQRLMTDMLAEASHHEQQRIARDLHDGLGQQITGIALKAKILENELEELENPDLSALSAEVVEQTKQASSQARDIAYTLAPVDIDPEGLISMLRKLLESSGKMLGFDYTFAAEDTAILVSSEAAMQLYRAVQEALTNAHRHGHASNISLVLECTDDHLVLTIEDDGRGLPEGFNSRNAAGVGLKIMRHRMSVVGGTCAVGQCGGDTTGVRVVFEVPLAREIPEVERGVRNRGFSDDEPEASMTGVPL